MFASLLPVAAGQKIAALRPAALKLPSIPIRERTAFGGAIYGYMLIWPMRSEDVAGVFNNLSEINSTPKS